MPSVLSEPYFHNEAAAFEALEQIVWPNGPSCPHCGNADPAKIGRLGVQRTKPSQKHPEGKPVYGLHKCYGCRGQFTVRKGTVFEDSPIELHIWFQAAHLMCSSKKGVSSNQLHRTLGVTLKTAWFMSMRLRAAMGDDMPAPMGGKGAAVEIDETYVGGLDKNRHANKRKHMTGGAAKAPVFALVERQGGARAYHVPEVSGQNLLEILVKNVARETKVYSDESPTTQSAAWGYKRDHVNHRSGEYVRGDAHTNTVEGFFAILKRGVIGTYHHVSEQHLNRYLAEFSFRYSERSALGVEDTERATKALKGISGKRLTYRSVDSRGTAPQTD